MAQACVLHLHECRSLSWLQMGLPGFGGCGWGETQAAGASDRKYLWGESWRDVQGVHWQLCWLLASTVAKSAKLQSQSLWTVITPAACLLKNSLCFSSLSQADSIRLGFPSPCEVKPKWDLGQCPTRVEKLVIHLILPFLARGAPSWEVPKGKTKLSSFSSCAIILRVFFFLCSTVLLNLSKWALEEFWSCFCSWILVQLLTFVGAHGSWVFQCCFFSTLQTNPRD